MPFFLFSSVIVEMFPHYCSSVLHILCFRVYQISSNMVYVLPCWPQANLVSWISVYLYWSGKLWLHMLMYVTDSNSPASFIILSVFFYFLSVTRRCFPALGQKGGVITVGNNSHFDDGSGKMRDAKDLMDGVKWVYVRVNTLHYL